MCAGACPRAGVVCGGAGQIVGQPVVIAEQVRGVTTPRAADPPSAVEIAGEFGQFGLY